MARAAKRDSTRQAGGELPAHPRFGLHVPWLVICGFALWGVLAAVSSMRLKSVTYDEVAHLTAGLTYWRTGDYRMTPDHPPLAQLLAAAPLLGLDIQMPSKDEPSWRMGFVWKYGRDLLNRPNNVEEMLYLGRLPMVGLWCVGGLVASLWSRQMFGPWGGVITAGL
ncbi:MAG: hypothetical protein JSU68_04455, partial [Phycisphaerales bacterium]